MKDLFVYIVYIVYLYIIKLNNMKNEVNKTVLENRAKFIKMAKELGKTEQQIESWLNDPAKLSIINALCAS